MNIKQGQLIISVAGALKECGINVVGIDVECMRSSEHWVRNLATLHYLFMFYSEGAC